jgi:hypothetical protein
VSERNDDLTTITEAIRLRGLFMHRYSGIEFGLSELIVRARRHPAYNSLGDLPKAWKRKVNRLERLITTEGPISAYEDAIRASLLDFHSFEQNRHFFVHGVMAIPPRAIDRTTLGFSMYDHRPIKMNGENISMVHSGRFEITLEAFDQLVAKLEPISSSFAILVARICREIPLPPLIVQAD